MIVSKRTISMALVLAIAITMLSNSSLLLPKAHAYWDPSCTPDGVAQLTWNVLDNMPYGGLPHPEDLVGYTVWAFTFASATGIPFQLLMANAGTALAVNPLIVGVVTFAVTSYCMIPGAQ